MKETKGAMGCWLIAFLFCVAMLTVAFVPVWRCVPCQGTGLLANTMIVSGGSPPPKAEPLATPCGVCAGSGRAALLSKFLRAP